MTTKALGELQNPIKYTFSNSGQESFRFKQIHQIFGNFRYLKEAMNNANKVRNFFRNSLQRTHFRHLGICYQRTRIDVFRRENGNWPLSENRGKNCQKQKSRLCQNHNQRKGKLPLQIQVIIRFTSSSLRPGLGYCRNSSDK